MLCIVSTGEVKMRICSLELKGYLRLSLSQIDFFRIEPQKDLQLILGTNGSGKSSILYEMFPLPASHTDFKPDGYKELVVLHNNTMYKLTSKNKTHSFLRGDEELNPGGTVTIQEELVYREFGINNKIRDLLLGHTKLSTMSVADRRYWFTEMCNTNYDYAIKVYNTFKDRLRDIQGSIKTNKRRLVSESFMENKDGEIRKLEREVGDFYTLVEELSKFRAPVDLDINNLISELSTIHIRISECNRSIIKETSVYQNGIVYKDLDEIKNSIVRLEERVSTDKKYLQEAIEKFKYAKEKVELFHLANSKEIKDSLEEKIVIENDISTLTKQLKYELEFDNPRDALNSLISNQENFNYIFENLPPNPNKEFSKAKYQEQLDRFIVLKNEITHNEGLLYKTTREEEKLTHLKEHDGVNCPKCNHSWYRQYDKGLHDNTKKLIEDYNLKIKSLEKEKSDVELYIVEANKYMETYRVFALSKQSNVIISNVFDLLYSSENFFNNPRSLHLIIDNIKTDLEIHIRIKDLKDKLAINYEKYLKVLNANSIDIEFYKSEVIKYEEIISNLTTSVEINTREIATNKELVKVISRILENQSQLIDLIKIRDSKLYDAKEMYRREGMQELIRSIQFLLATKEKALYELKSKQNIIKDIESNISILEKEEETYKTLVNILNPTDGLIAEGLYGFLNVFVKQMNMFIKSIWSYDLEVLPNKSRSIDLDYRFPLLIENSIEVKDISRGSTGIKEVCDLAFKIIAMRYLHLEKFPLFLDEFGSSFDIQHRTKAMEIVKQLIEQQPFTQLFIINHYSGEYGSLTNADITVLHSENIVIPDRLEYNKHVVMK